MTTQRDFKKLVRERMAKTGERYATARSQILAKRTPSNAGHRHGVFADYGTCGGIQTETSALRNVLRHAGLACSEAQVHGLCGGIGFLYAVFEYKGIPPLLTIVGRAHSMPDAFAAEGISRAPVVATVHETTGAKKAQADLDAALAAGRPALCTVDGAALPHHGLPKEMHGMGPHVVAAIGRDGDSIWIDDRAAQPVRVPRDAFAAARAGYRKGKHRLVTLISDSDVISDGDGDGDASLEAAVLDGLRFTADRYDVPPAAPFASNVGTAGLEKWARLLTADNDKKGWPRVFRDKATAYIGLRRTYDCTQHAYSAPAAGRPLFAQTLDEAADETGVDGLRETAAEFRSIGERWNALADCIVSSDDTVARGCALSDRRAELLDTGGAEATDEIRETWLERRALGDACPLSANAAAAIYAELAVIISEIAERERAALHALRALL